jgi:hypothetical protein
MFMTYVDGPGRRLRTQDCHDGDAVGEIACVC